MIFWKRFDKQKPKKSGWYLCTVNAGTNVRLVKALWWDAGRERDL